MIQGRMDETIEETGATVARVVNGVMEQVKRVQDLVEHLTSTADATVTQVRETAQQTMVKGTPGTELIADLYRRPWMMVGTAVLLGYVLGSSGRSSIEQKRTSVQSPPQVPPHDRVSDNPTGNPFIAPASPPAGRSAPATSSARATGPTGAPSS
jgi:ElaB/YqjD/DUF883 family membrane-anchored ribosome-binding protein